MDTREADGFYSELTARNGGFVSQTAQQALSRATVLIAGCGSTGGAAVEPLVRLGVGAFALADNGDFELNNLNRQSAGLADVGRSKAVVAGERIGAINPHARLTVATDGITAHNVLALVAAADVVIDGVDVTETAGWRAKLLLHQAAAALGRPVVTGYDMAGRQYVHCYDYRRPGRRAFDGRIDDARVGASNPWTLLLRVIPLRRIPWEMVADARVHLDEPDYHVSQLVYTSMLFGAIAGRMTVALIAGEGVAEHVTVDVHELVRTPGARTASKARWVAQVLRATSTIIGLRRRAGEPGPEPERIL